MIFSDYIMPRESPTRTTIPTSSGSWWSQVLRQTRTSRLTCPFPKREGVLHVASPRTSAMYVERDNNLRFAMKKGMGLMRDVNVADEIPASSVTDDELHGALDATWINRWKIA